MRGTLRSVLASIVTLLCANAASAFERVTFPATDPQATAITGYLFRPTVAATVKTPAIVALHGCGGLFTKRDPGRLTARHADWAERWVQAGYTVLFPDSFGSRGLGDLCAVQDRGINPRMRAQDALGAATWLAKQPNIDAARLALVGWSNGGSTALQANDQRLTPTVDFKTVIAFYPGCRPIEERGTWKPRKPMTILIGAADDWTPAAPCQALAAKTGISITAYPDAYHDFDAPNTPIRLRTGLTFTASGKGIAHVGTNPAARAAAIADVTRILAEAFK